MSSGTADDQSQIQRKFSDADKSDTDNESQDSGPWSRFSNGRSSGF